MTSYLKTQYFDSTGELQWNGLIYPMRAFDVRNYTKVSNAINEELLSGEEFRKNMASKPVVSKDHWSMKASGSQFDRTVTHLNLSEDPIGEADIELKLRMQVSKEIVGELFEHIDKVKDKEI